SRALANGVNIGLNVMHRQRGRVIHSTSRVRDRRGSGIILSTLLQPENRRPVPALPVELLAEIVKYLKFSPSIHYERPPQSAPALANAARVWRLFYELAMPLLWEEVHLWGPSTV